PSFPTRRSSDLRLIDLARIQCEWVEGAGNRGAIRIVRSQQPDGDAHVLVGGLNRRVVGRVDAQDVARRDAYRPARIAGHRHRHVPRVGLAVPVLRVGDEDLLRYAVTHQLDRIEQTTGVKVPAETD